MWLFAVCRSLRFVLRTWTCWLTLSNPFIGILLELWAAWTNGSHKSTKLYYFNRNKVRSKHRMQKLWYLLSEVVSDLTYVNAILLANCSAISTHQNNKKSWLSTEHDLCILLMTPIDCTRIYEMVMRRLQQKLCRSWLKCEKEFCYRIP